MPLLSCSLRGPVPLPPAPPHRRRHQGYADLEAVRALVESNSSAKKPAGLCPAPSSPIHSLHRGDWVKLICGASFELEFDPEECPPDCLRPCERVCPANAISLEIVPVEGGNPEGIITHNRLQGGVITERCYGCGRCFPVCPYDKIEPRAYIRDTAVTSELLRRDDVDAIEIHTSGRHPELFKRLWSSLGDSLRHVKLVAVSLPHAGESVVSAMSNLYSVMETSLQCHNLWQLDGRPMSGDIGRGATKDAISFAVHLAAVGNRPPGFLQLAGGTNAHTVDCLKEVGLFQTWAIPDRTDGNASFTTSNGSLQTLIGGVAYGGYARKVVGRVLNQLSTQHGRIQIEEYPEHLLEALRQALSLVGPVKR